VQALRALCFAHASLRSRPLQVKGQRRELLTSYEQKLDGMDKNEQARQEVLARAAAQPPVHMVRFAPRWLPQRRSARGGGASLLRLHLLDGSRGVQPSAWAVHAAQCASGVAAAGARRAGAHAAPLRARVRPAPTVRACRPPEPPPARATPSQWMWTRRSRRRALVRAPLRLALCRCAAYRARAAHAPHAVQTGVA
jgi:hypothetical protein